MKNLYITKEIPNNALILLIDVEETFFDELIEELDDEENVEEIISERLLKMRNRLIQLKNNGHDIVASVRGDIHPLIEDLVDDIIDEWDIGMDNESENLDIAEAHILNPLIIEKVKEYDQVVVAGLWQELCVYVVSRKLQSVYGDKALLLYNEDLTFESSLSILDNDIELQDVCNRDNVNIVLK